MLAQGHLVADDCFVDALDRIDDTGQRFARTGSPAPSGWVRTERGGWISLHRDGVPLPRQGWKIHASATADRAEHVVNTVWDHCTRHSVSFKFLRSPVLFHHMNSKQAPRSASGKLVTVYPADERELERTLTGLTALLGGIEGAYVLSDLRWQDGPLYVRYGGFHLAYCFAPDGEYVPAIEGPDGVLLPDVRGTSFRVPPWVEPPGFLAARIEASRAAAPGGFPYRVEKALHFSNGGGVYRAVDQSTGRRVVLREARPHAGLDDRGADAVARLAHEQKMLEHLAGLGCVPALYGRVRHWEHHFLVEELVEGETLQEAVGRRHPLFRDGADESDVAAYTLWALGLIGRVEEAVAALHARGVVFGDLQPGNIMVRPDDSVCLVDFETAFAEADDHRPALGTPGFTALWARSGRSVDEYGLAAVSLALFCPLTPLLRFDRDKYVQLTDWTRRRFPVRPEFTAALRERLAPPPHWPRADHDVPPDGSPWPETPGADVGPALDSLAEAIRLSATPEREDRLFPGDVRQFDNQGASLAFGAAGVLHALLVCGYGEDPAFEGAFEEYVDWLARAAERTRWPRPGLYDGLAGVAYVLDELGRTDQGRAALDRIDGIGLDRCGAGLFGGLAGIGLARLRVIHRAPLVVAQHPFVRAAFHHVIGTDVHLAHAAGRVDHHAAVVGACSLHDLQRLVDAVHVRVERHELVEDLGVRVGGVGEEPRDGALLDCIELQLAEDRRDRPAVEAAVGGHDAVAEPLDDKHRAAIAELHADFVALMVQGDDDAEVDAAGLFSGLGSQSLGAVATRQADWALARLPAPVVREQDIERDGQVQDEVAVENEHVPREQ